VAKLILLALDIPMDRQERGRFVKVNAKETLEADPSTGDMRWQAGLPIAQAATPTGQTDLA
jgi:hypothetical protein